MQAKEAEGRTLLVVGATGYLGRFLVQAGLDRGWRVRALVRDRATADLPDGVELFEGQVTVPLSLTGVAKGVDVVVSALGITRQTDAVTYDDVDHRGNLAVLEEAVQSGVSRFLYVSVLHAERAVHTDLVAAKERFARALLAAPLEGVVVRPTGFFSDMLDFLEMARGGRAYVFGDGQTRLNPIHGADLADFCLQACEGPTERELPVGGPDTYSQRELAGLAFEVLGTPPRITGVPLWLVHLLLALVKPFQRRWWNIGSFMASSAAGEMVGPAHGVHHLRDTFAAHALRSPAPGATRSSPTSPRSPA